MITLQNYTEKTKGIDFSKQAEVIQKGHKFFSEYSDLYNDDDDIKKAIDNHLQRLNDYLKVTTLKTGWRSSRPVERNPWAGAAAKKRNEGSEESRQNSKEWAQ